MKDTTERAPYWPGLDGLRGLAVAAVLLFHGGVSWAQGGFLGVSLFFTLSGFLITSIVVRERSATGAVSLTGFWARRARRLLPASVLALLLAIVAVRAAVPFAQRTEALGDVRAAALNLANWRFIWRGAVYADVTRLPSPVQHYWSLAIEEQFYLVFPVVAMVALRWRRRGLAAVLGAVVVLSTWRQLSIDDTARVYFGTDTRAAELAIGGLLALGRTRISDLAAGSWRRLPDAVGLVALVATAILWSSLSDTAPGLYAGGFTGIALVSTALVFAAVEGQVVPRLLAVRPLVWLGVISYGVYLYHFPLYLIMTEATTGLSRWPLLAVQVGLTFVIAAVSYRIVEQPIRRGRRLRGQRATLALATSMALVLVAAFGYTSRLENRLDGDLIAAASVEVLVAPASASGDSIERAPHLLVVGDSTAAGIGRALTDWAADTGRLRVTTVTSAGCAAYSGTRMRVREGYEFSPKGCDDLFTTAARTAVEQQADAIVVWIGSSQLADWTYEGRDGWFGINDPEVRRGYERALARTLTELAAAGVPVLWADLPVPQWDLEEFGKRLGGPLPGSGAVTLNDPARAAVVSEINAATVPGNPMVVLWPWRAHLESPDGTISRAVRPDGLHVDEARVGEFAEAWLFDVLDQSYDEVVARRPPGLRAPADHTWAADA
jgi:peptidoglycan/LPS O-acetylase OafA/YrhL